MIPFNFELVKKGEKVVTRDGDEVSNLTEFNTEDEYCLAGTVRGSIKTWTIEGRYNTLSDAPHSSDLFIEEEELFVNVFLITDVKGQKRKIASGCFNSLEAAIESKKEKESYGVAESLIFHGTYKLTAI